VPQLIDAGYVDKNGLVNMLKIQANEFGVEIPEAILKFLNNNPSPELPNNPSLKIVE